MNIGTQYTRFSHVFTILTFLNAYRNARCQLYTLVSLVHIENSVIGYYCMAIVLRFACLLSYLPNSSLILKSDTIDFKLFQFFTSEKWKYGYKNQLQSICNCRWEKRVNEQIRFAQSTLVYLQKKMVNVLKDETLA